MRTYKYFMFDGPQDSPPKFFDADDCKLEKRITRYGGVGGEPVMSWVFYVDGQEKLEIPVRMVLGKPMAVSAKKGKE